MRSRRVAVLGAGVMGSSLAIFLARRGAEVVLVDRATEPMSAASRWNEGKIHLGYLYGADPTLATARHVLPGGLRFAPLLAELVGTDLGPHVTSSDDTYLVHRRSVVDASTVRARFAAVSDLVRRHPDAASYLVDASLATARELPVAELQEIATDEIVTGFTVPERSIDTRWVADHLAGAVFVEPGVTLRLGTAVHRVCPLESIHGPWRVVGSPGLDETFDVVVNALWDGRLAVDTTAGLALPDSWTHRYRLALFVRTHRTLGHRSAVAAVGPFGDVKNFAGRDFYLSWYPAGLMSQSEAVAPPPVPRLGEDGEQELVRAVRSGLESVLPGVGEVLDAAEEILVRGGQVYARGTGALGEQGSGLHRRDRYGVDRRGTYLSIDTGKYSTAPWLAERVAREIVDG